MGAGSRWQDIAILNVGPACRVTGQRPGDFVGITDQGVGVPLRPAPEGSVLGDRSPATALKTDQAASFALGFANIEMCDPIPPSRTYDAIEFTFAGRRMRVDLDPDPSIDAPMILAAHPGCGSEVGLSELAAP